MAVSFVDSTFLNWVIFQNFCSFIQGDPHKVTGEDPSYFCWWINPRNSNYIILYIYSLIDYIVPVTLPFIVDFPTNTSIQSG